MNRTNVLFFHRTSKMMPKSKDFEAEIQNHSKQIFLEYLELQSTTKLSSSSPLKPLINNGQIMKTNDGPQVLIILSVLSNSVFSWISHILIRSISNLLILDFVLLSIFTHWFCNLSFVKGMNYLNVLFDSKAHRFSHNFYNLYF